MKEQEKLRLKKVYEEMPDEELIEMLLVNKKEYEEGIYELVLEEAHKRGIEEKAKEIKKERLLSKADFAGLSKYYREEFTKIYESNESYKGKWNWGAFFFSGLWAIVKGLWGIIIIWFVVLFFSSCIVSLVIFFSSNWAMTKGTWGNTIFSLVTLVFTIAIAIIALLGLPFFLGVRGTYKYYCHYAEKKNKIRPIKG